jgi:hypothetical protein
MRGIRHHLTFANITAVLALVVAMGGTAYAGGLITSKQIKNHTIKNADIHGHTIKANRLVPSARSNVLVGTPTGSIVQIPYANFDYDLATLAIPGRGTYLITATFSLVNNDPFDGHGVTCTLSSGESTSPATTDGYAYLGSQATEYRDETMALQLPHTFAAGQIVVLSCKAQTTYTDNTKVVSAYNVVLTAVQVDSISTPPAG